MQSGSGQLRPFLFAIAVSLWSGLPLAAQTSLTLDSNLFWNHPAGWFGGLSGMEISQDGMTLTVISDRGSLITAGLTRSAGRIVGATITSRLRLRDRNGTPRRGRFRDAEGLAISNRGRAYISFEHRHRVALLDLRTGVARALAAHPDFAGFPLNSGLEALAVHPDGRLFTLSEGSHDGTGTFPLYVLGKSGWRITHRIQQNRPFVPVGADFDAWGRLYVLERTVGPLGFRSRIRRFDLNAVPATSTTLLTTFSAQFDNLEALSVWQDPQGRTRLTLLSDNNFLPLQRTQLVEYILTE